MSRRRAFEFVVCLAGLLACRLVSGAGPEVSAEAVTGQTVDILSVDEAIRLALDRSRNLDYLETDVAIAEHRRESAGSFENPELRVENSMDRSGANHDDEYRIGLRWQPPRYGELSGDRLDEAVAACEERIDAVRFRHELINRIRKAHAEVLMNDGLADLAELQLDLETKRLRIVEQMVALGRRSIVYETKARMWVAETRHEYAQSQRRRRSARRDLSQLTGKPEEILLSEEDVAVTLQDVDALVETALQSRPEVGLAKLQTERAIHRSRIERYKLAPRVTFMDLSVAIEENRDDRMEVRMGIELPLFRWRTDYFEARELAVKRREIESSAVHERIRDEIHECYEIYLDRLTDWQNFNADVTRMIEGTEQVIRTANENPVLAPDEVLELDLVLVETRRILVEKRFRLSEALADLYLAMGVENYDPVSGRNEMFDVPAVR